MEEADKKKLAKARNKVYQLLKYRLRSEKEIRDKLKTKKFSGPIIDGTVEYFKELGLIDDREFARAWINSRLSRPFGSRRIQYELKQKGIDRNIQDEELNKALEAYCEEDVVLDLARRRAQKYKGMDPRKIKQRLYGYLSRRGFSAQAIYKAIRQLQ